MTKKVKFTIEKLKLTDLNKFYKTFTEVLREGFPEYQKLIQDFFLNKDYTKEHFKKHIKSGIDLVVKIDGKVVGFLTAGFPYGGVSFCYWLGVIKDYRGLGIGRAMLSAWEKEAKKIGAHRLQFLASKWNIPFYKKCGFKLEGFAKTGYFGVDDYYFGKIISRLAKSY